MFNVRPRLSCLIFCIGCGGGEPNAVTVAAATDAGDPIADEAGFSYSSNARELLAEGDTRRNAGDFDGAESIYQQLIQHFAYSSTAPIAEFHLADILYARKQYAEAAAAYEKFVHDHPSNPLVQEGKDKATLARQRIKP
jgi:outer membrane protein assembly factor BamD (BamD/ComL family)